MFITVAICTWNRCQLLDQTLARMQDLQVPPGVDWELLVVNNNCTDGTDEVLARYSSRMPIRRLTESRQGHSHARNCAVAAARGELLLWTDDDVLVAPDWLAEYVRAFHLWPDAAFFGGPIDPWLGGTVPRWFERHFNAIKGIYVIIDHGPEVRRLAQEEGVAGANMAFRTTILRRFPFNAQLGRVKGGLVGADDTELVSRLRAAGQPGAWIGTARVQHYLPADRLNLAYFRRWHIDAGRTQVRLQGLPGGAFLWDAPRWAWKQYYQSLLKVFLLSPFKGKFWLEAVRKNAFLRGMILESRLQRGQARIGEDHHGSV